MNWRTEAVRAGLTSLIVALSMLMPSLANAWSNGATIQTAQGSLEGYVSNDAST